MIETGLLLVFWISFLVGLSGAVSPGPLLALSIREAARHGWTAGPSISTGHAATELAVVVLLALGLGPYLNQESVTTAIGLIGGTVLLWMAWRIGLHPQRGTPSLQAHHTLGPSGARRPVVNGILATFSNPFWFVWWVTVGAALMARSYEWGALGIAVFYIGHVSADYFWFGLVAFVVGSGRKLMTPVVYGATMLLCAGFLGLLGAYFIVSGAANLL